MTITIALPMYPRREIIFDLFATRTNKIKINSRFNQKRRGEEKGVPNRNWRNKNRLSSTTYGEELQKIFKDWQIFERFVFLTFLTSK